jgi:hypothetical protein
MEAQIAGRIVQKHVCDNDLITQHVHLGLFASLFVGALASPTTQHCRSSFNNATLAVAADPCRVARSPVTLETLL